MPIFLFVAQDVDPQTRQPLAIPPGGHVERFCLYYPGRAEEAVAYAKHNNIGSWKFRSYQCWECNKPFPQPILLAIQQATPPAMSAQHVQGGQPVGAPAGQQGQNRQDSPRDGMGFVQHGDGALGAGGDGGMFADNPDLMGTYTDLYDGGRMEVPRAKS